MDLSELDFLAIFFAALCSFLLGAAWYSPLLFKRIWMEGCGLTELDLRQSNVKFVFVTSFALSLVMAFTLAILLGEQPALGIAVGGGFVIGLCWVATAFGISYVFEQRPLKLFLVNASYHVLQYTLMGLVLGLWP